MSEFYTGAVIDWFDGFGFIARDDGDPDAFVHIRDAITQDDGFDVGTRVRFKLRNNRRTGRLQAFDCAAIIAEHDSLSVGTIAKWAQDGRYCFIRPADGGEDVFAHGSAIEGGAAALPIGSRVRFTASTNPRTGRPRALSVRAA
jgi:cold shock CspA family protein